MYNTTENTLLQGRGMSGDGYESDFFYSMNSGPAPFPNLDLPPLDTDMQVNVVCELIGVF